MRICSKTLIHYETVETAIVKRLPLGPADAHVISTKNNLPQTMRPAAYETTI